VEFVHELAQNDSIAERLFKGWLCERFTGQGLDPLLSFLFLFSIALSGDLKQIN
jgi:hypothetical protein